MSVTYKGTIQKVLYNGVSVGNDGACCFVLGFGSSTIDWGTNPPTDKNFATTTLDNLIATVNSNTSQYAYNIQYNIIITGSQYSTALESSVTDIAFYDQSDTNNYCNTTCPNVYACTSCSKDKLAVPAQKTYTAPASDTYNINDTFTLDTFADSYPYSISIYVHNACNTWTGCESHGATNYTFTLTMQVALTINQPAALYGCINNKCIQGTGSQYTYQTADDCSPNCQAVPPGSPLWGCIGGSCTQGTGSQYTYNSQSACQADSNTSCYVAPAPSGSQWGCIGGTCTQGTGGQYNYDSEADCQADNSTSCYVSPGGISTKTIIIIAGVVIGLILLILLITFFLKKRKSAK